MPLKNQWKDNIVNELQEGVFTYKTHRKGMPQTNSTKGDAQSLQKLKNLKKWSRAKQTTGWGCPTTLKEVGVC